MYKEVYEAKPFYGVNPAFVIFCVITVLITLILSLHFYLQKFPFWLVIIAQYALTAGIVFLAIFIHGRFSTNAPTAYWDMFVSITIPFIFGALVYYICFFVQIKRANKVLEKLNSEE